MESAQQEVAAEVRAWLGRQRRSAHSIAKELGWSDFYMSRRIRGDVAFNVADLAAVAGALGVPVTAFIPPNLGVIKRKQ